MSAYRYARETGVSVSRSREEIERTLRNFGADQLQWSDDFKNGRVRLRFAWTHDQHTYLARFDLQLPTDDQLRKHSLDGRSGEFSQRKYDEAKRRYGMVEHRDLALFLKAAFVAVEAHIIAPEQIFLAFLEGQDGTTVAEALVPRLDRLLTPSGAAGLLKAAFDG
jgi:hypothetical protein